MYINISEEYAASIFSVTSSQDEQACSRKYYNNFAISKGVMPRRTPDLKTQSHVDKYTKVG
jgi:hypothetical protein